MSSGVGTPKSHGLPENLQIHSLELALKDATNFRDTAQQKHVLELFNAPGINNMLNEAEGESEREYGNRMVYLHSAFLV